MKKRFLYLLMLVTLLAMNTACLSEDNQQQGYNNNDGMMGLSNSNPSMRTSPMSNNYKRDEQMVDLALEPIEGIDSYRIMINGAKLHIKLTLSDNITSAQAQEIEEQAIEVLTYQLPRYEIEVTSNYQ